MKNVFQRILITPARKIRRAALQIADQAAFDWRYGTETSRFMTLDVLSTESPHKSQCNDYQPSDAREFRSIIGNLPHPSANYTFVDFGCGKGRTLLLAAQAGFRNVVGVEFSPHLVKIAAQNISIFQHRVPHANLCVVCADATDFPIPPGDCILYFYNPFRGQVMKSVVENLRHSYIENPRSIYVALKNCVKSYPLFDALPFLRCMARKERRRNWLTVAVHAWAVYGPNSPTESERGDPPV